MLFGRRHTFMIEGEGAGREGKDMLHHGYEP